MRYWRPLMLTFTCAMDRLHMQSLRFEDQPDVLHRGIDPAGDVAVGGFEAAAAGKHRRQIGGEPGAVGGERMDLLAQRRPLAVALDPALDRGVERIQRLRKTPRRLLDRCLLGHGFVQSGPILIRAVNTAIAR